MSQKPRDFPDVICLVRQRPIFTRRQNGRIDSMTLIGQRRYYASPDAIGFIGNGQTFEIDIEEINKQNADNQNAKTSDKKDSVGSKKRKAEDSESDDDIKPKKTKLNDDSDSDYEAESDKPDGRYGWHNAVSDFKLLRPGDFSETKKFTENDISCNIYCYETKWYVASSEFKSCTGFRIGVKNVLAKYTSSELMTNKYLYRYKASTSSGGPTIIVNINILLGCIPEKATRPIAIVKNMQAFIAEKA
jgi:hypothetical protein